MMRILGALGRRNPMTLSCLALEIWVQKGCWQAWECGLQRMGFPLVRSVIKFGDLGFYVDFPTAPLLHLKRGNKSNWINLFHPRDPGVSYVLL
jgi:hypothetical protein